MNRNSLLLALLLSGASSIAVAQMPNSTNPMPQTPAGQPGRPGTMGGEIPNIGNGPTGAQGTTPAAPKVDDADLQRDVKQGLASDPAYSDVQVTAHNGHVELTGSVPTKEDRKKAKDVAKNIPGVTSIKEHLTVGGGRSSNGTTPASSPEQNTAGSISGNSGGSKPGSTASPAGSNNPTNTNPPNANPSNSNSPNQSSPPDTSSPHSYGSTGQMAGMRESGGARLINGAYPLQSGSAAAGSPPDNQAQSANSAPSGASTMNGRANGSDNSTVQAQIENAIHNDPALGNSHVSILVSDTAIDMSGTVPTSKDRVSATRIAQSFGANRKIVNDKLMVTGHGHSDMPPPHPAMDSSGTSDNTQQNQSGNTTPHR